MADSQQFDTNGLRKQASGGPGKKWFAALVALALVVGLIVWYGKNDQRMKSPVASPEPTSSTSSVVQRAGNEPQSLSSTGAERQGERDMLRNQVKEESVPAAPVVDPKQDGDIRKKEETVTMARDGAESASSKMNPQKTAAAPVSVSANTAPGTSASSEEGQQEVQNKAKPASETASAPVKSIEVKQDGEAQHIPKTVETLTSRGKKSLEIAPSTPSSKNMPQISAVDSRWLNWQESIVDLLKLLGRDSSHAARAQLAAELGCPAEKMTTSRAQNIWLHKTVMEKNADIIPKKLP